MDNNEKGNVRLEKDGQVPDTGTSDTLKKIRPIKKVVKKTGAVKKSTAAAPTAESVNDAEKKPARKTGIVRKTPPITVKEQAEQQADLPVVTIEVEAAVKSTVDAEQKRNRPARRKPADKSHNKATLQPAVETETMQQENSVQENSVQENSSPQPFRPKSFHAKKKQQDKHSVQSAEQSEVLAETVESASDADEAKDADSKNRQKHRSKDKKTEDAAEQKQQAENKSKKGRSKLFISVQAGEQVEVVLAEEGVIQEYYVEMDHQAKTKGNIYKGVVSNVDANLQAAFINYGHNKNGFLQIDEVHPEYYLQKNEKSRGKKYPPIQKVLRPGQEVLVQVVKEPTGGKGAFVTTYISIPGRFLVLTPGAEQIGVSRKVEDEAERSRLRELLEGVQVGEGLGLIIRTVSVGTSKVTIQKDLQFLKRVWKEVRRKGLEETAPSLIYQEPGLASRAVRDYLSEDVAEVWVDDEATYATVLEYVTLLFPRKSNLVKLHKDHDHTMWERFSIQRQLDQVYAREVRLPSGGRLVFDQTEALMAIDINSGRISGKTNFETMALRTNIEAAEAIAQQLRLRDVGGQIVIDFIEMKDQGHIREVENTMREAMKIDRARHDLSKMSRFGLLEVVRQRTASSALAITTEPCPHCQGTGIRRNLEWQAQQTLRELSRQLRVAPKTVSQSFVFAVPLELVMYILNHKRERIAALEQLFSTRIEVVAS